MEKGKVLLPREMEMEVVSTMRAAVNLQTIGSSG